MTIQSGQIIYASDILAISATANSALSVANTAISTANTAITNAATALSTAEGVSGIANTAISTANAAQTTANSVSGIANTALTNSTAAQTTANTAISDANSAQTAASNAQTTANAAQTTANAAIPNSKINVANGVAGLDSLGNASALTVIPTGGTTAQTLAQIAYNANHSTFTITGLTTDSSILSTDYLGASDGTNDFKILVSNFITSVGTTVGNLPAASAVAVNDTFITDQSGTIAQQTAGNISSFTLNRIPLYFYNSVELTSNTNLDPTVHNNKILVCSQPLTISVGNSFVGTGFTTTILNVSGGTVTLGSGFITTNGGSTIANNGYAEIIAVTYSGGNIYFANLGGTGVPAVGLTIGASKANVPTGVSIGVIGTVNPSGTAVQIAISTSNTTVPTSGWTSATVAGYNFTGTIAGQSNGTYYIWAQEVNNTSVTAVTGAIVVSTYSLAITSAPSTGNTATPYSCSGTVAPTSQAVQVQLGTSATVVPTGTWTTATVNGTTWSASFTPPSTGTFYLWAQQTNQTNVVATSSAITISAPSNNVAITSPPTSAYENSSVSLTGTLYPGGAAVQVQFGSSNTVAPTGSWTAATVTGTSWTANLTAPSTAGTFYIWAQQTLSPTVEAVSPAVTVSAVPPPSIATTYGTDSFALTILSTSGSGIGTPPFPNGGNMAWQYSESGLPSTISSDFTRFFSKTPPTSKPTPDGTTIIQIDPTNSLSAIISSSYVGGYSNWPTVGTWYFSAWRTSTSSGFVTTAFTVD